MKWLDKNMADAFTDVIKSNYRGIIDKTAGRAIEFTVDGKRYLLSCDRNAGVHYCFDIYEIVNGREIKVATGDLPAVEVDPEYQVIRFNSTNNAVIYEYGLEA